MSTNNERITYHNQLIDQAKNKADALPDKTDLSPIIEALTDKGQTVPDGASVDVLADLIAAIEAGGGGLPVRAYGSIVLTEDQSTDYVIDTGIRLTNTNKIVVFWKNTTGTRVKGSLLYTSLFGLAHTSTGHIAVGYRGGAEEVYSSSSAGIVKTSETRTVTVGGKCSANFSFGFKAGLEYIWLVME